MAASLQSRLLRALTVLACAALPAAADGQQDHGDIVTINYPDELPLTGLVDYVSQTLDIKILYGEELRGKKIVLRPSPVEVPRSRLLDLLSSALRIREMALVQDQLEGFWRVVPAAELQRVVTEIREQPSLTDISLRRIVSQVISVPSGDVKQLAAHLKSFMSSAQASLIEVPERELIIVTDYESVVARLVRLAELIEARREQTAIEPIPVRYAEPARLAGQLRLILQEGQGPKRAAQLQILADVIPGHVVVIGTPAQIERVQGLVAQLDVQRDAVVPVRRYTPRHISAKRLATLIEELVLAPVTDGSIRLFVDESANQLFLTAPANTQQRAAALLQEMDVPTPVSARRMRIYRPRNRSAAEILGTLLHLLEDVRAARVTGGAGEARPDAEALQTIPHSGPLRSAIQLPPQPPAESGEGGSAESGPLQIIGQDYVLTEDEHTNIIIAIATPEFHEQLGELIEELDRRRPQVLIEVTLVAVNLSDSLDLGIELQSLDLGDGWDYLLFSSFGLSTVDVSTGQRVLTPGVGANGVLISPTETPVIFRALATHGDTRVISTPRIVVSDNSTGTLRSVDEAPFSSVNASQTVATTSFAGFESAGTTLTVTPHIAEGDHLLLDYTLAFSSFTGSASDSVSPPPRATNSYSATVEVPDGHTVVVGGLVVENESDTISEVPFLGRLPIIGVLFQRSVASRTRSRVFAFIRPVILRDDQFEDLKYYTQAELEESGLENTDYPPHRVMWMR